MFTASQTRQMLQQFFILGAGRTANDSDMAQLEAALDGDGGLTGISAIIDSYMGQQALQLGTRKVLQNIAWNGLGLTLTDAQADIAAQDIQALGITSWSGLFTWLSSNEGTIGVTLENRSEAANFFNILLTVVGKTDLYSGNAVNLSVTNLLNNIDASAISLTNAKRGLGELGANLSADGVEAAVFDGYLRGANVFIDTNSDGLPSNGEWTTTTDVGGHFILPDEGGDGAIIASGGIDILTGQVYRGILTAPAGSMVVNPFTTLMQYMLANGQASSAAHASATIQTALNLPVDINLLAYDPLAVLADNAYSDSAKAVALQVQAQMLQVANLITVVANAIQSAGSGSSISLYAASSAVTVALGNSLAGSAGVVDLGDSETLATIIGQATQATTDVNGNSVLSDTYISQIAMILADINTAAVNATTIGELSRVAVVAQDQVTDAIISGVTSGGSLNLALASFTDAALAVAISAATPGFITPDVPAVIPPAVEPEPEPSSYTVTADADISGLQGGAAIAEVLDASAVAVINVTMTLAQHNGFSVINANGFNDTITLTNTGTLTADADIATYVLAAGSNSVATGAASQTINANALADEDVLTLTGSHNVAVTLVAGDLTSTSSGDITVTATTGSNVITTGAGADTITGGAGVDSITVGDGADRVTIGAGQDIVNLTETAAAADTVIFANAFAAGNANAATITGFANGAGADRFDIGFALQHGVLTFAAGTGTTNTVAASAPVTVGNHGSTAANTGVIFLLPGAGDQLAGGTSINNAVTNAVTALTSVSDFAAANVATGDSLVLVMDDGTNSFVFHYVADGTAGTTSAADLELIGIIGGVADAGTFATGDFI